MAIRVLIWHTWRLFSSRHKKMSNAMDFLGISGRQASIRNELTKANERATMNTELIARADKEQETKISEAKERLKRKIEAEKKKTADEIEEIRKHFRFDVSVFKEAIAKAKDDVSRLKAELASTEETRRDIQEHANVTGGALIFSSPKSRARSMPERDANWERDSRERAAAYLIGLNGTVAVYFQPSSREVVSLRSVIPEITARTFEGIDELVAANNEDDYATICSLDNLDAAEKLVFSDKPSSFLKRCFYSSLASPDASYRMCGYLMQRLMVDATFDLDEMIAVWTLGFDGLQWTPTDWLDSLAPGPGYTSNLRIIRDPLHRDIPPVPGPFLARSCQYQRGTPAQLRAQRFRYQASKLFALCDIVHPGPGLLVDRVCVVLGPRDQEPPKPIALTIEDFAIRHSKVRPSIQAIALAKQVVERLVGYFDPPKEISGTEAWARFARRTREQMREEEAAEARRAEEDRAAAEKDEEEIMRSFRAKLAAVPVKQGKGTEVLDLT